MTVDLDLHLPLIAAGHRDAFARWMAGAELPMRQSLRSFATRVDVESVMQEALLRTWQIAPRVELDGKPNALLRVSLRIARNLAIDEVRRTRRLCPGDEDIDASLDFAARAEPPDPMLRKWIRHCHERLPARPALALEARLDASEPDAAIAARLGMRLNTFLQNFTRARKLLIECLRARGVDIRELA